MFQVSVGTIYIMSYTTSSLQRHHTHTDTQLITEKSWIFWSILSSLFDRDTSDKDHQHTSFASSRKTSSFYLRAYSGSYCRRQIPLSVFFLQQSFSIIFSYNQPSSLATGHYEVEETYRWQLSQSSSCLFSNCSMLQFWLVASGRLGSRGPFCWGLWQSAHMSGFWQMWSVWEQRTQLVSEYDWNVGRTVQN